MKGEPLDEERGHPTHSPHKNDTPLKSRSQYKALLKAELPILRTPARNVGLGALTATPVGPDVLA